MKDYQPPTHSTYRYAYVQGILVCKANKQTHMEIFGYNNLYTPEVGETHIWVLHFVNPIVY